MNAAVERGEDPTFPASSEFITNVKFADDATITLGSKADARVKLHELGHADGYARHPIEYRKDLSTPEKKKPHDERAGEKKANDYRDHQKTSFDNKHTVSDLYQSLGSLVAFSSFLRGL